MFILYIFNTTLKYSFLKLFYQFTKIKLPRVHVQFEEKKYFLNFFFAFLLRQETMFID